MELKLGQERLAGELALIRSQQVINHAQNRRDIHDLRNSTQDITDSIVQIKIKFARLGGYACGVGAAVSVFIKIIDHFWK